MINNLSFLKDHAPGDTQYQQDLIMTYIRKMSQYLQNLNTNFILKNWKGLILQAHKMKSPAMLFGNEELKDLLDYIETNKPENLAKNPDLEDKILSINKLLPESISELKHILADEILVSKVNSLPKINNLKFVEDHASGDTEYIKDLILLYINKMPEYLQDMETHFEKKELDQMRLHAQKMKSPSALFGDLKLKEMLFTIEKKDFTSDDLQSRIALVKEHLSKSLKELHQILTEF